MAPEFGDEKMDHSKDLKPHEVAYLMESNLGELKLSPKTEALLTSLGFKTVAHVWDAIGPDEYIKGFTKRHREQVIRALGNIGAPMNYWGQCNSHVAVGLAMRKIGVDDGMAKARRQALTQSVEFSVTNRTALEHMKDRLLEAFEKKVDFIGFAISIKHMVPGIGLMHGPGDLALPVSALSTMLRLWNPAERKPVMGTCIIKLNRDMEPRKAEIMIRLDSWTGRLDMQPPDEETRKRFEELGGADVQVRRGTD